MANEKESLGNDVNMMPGFLVIGMSCFGMPYGAQAATWTEIAKDDSSWIEVHPTKSTVKYVGNQNAS